MAAITLAATHPALMQNDRISHAEAPLQNGFRSPISTPHHRGETHITRHGLGYDTPFFTTSWNQTIRPGRASASAIATH